MKKCHYLLLIVTRLKRNSSEIEKGLVEKFDKGSEELTEANRAKAEEEKILINRWMKRWKLFWLIFLINPFVS